MLQLTPEEHNQQELFIKEQLKKDTSDHWNHQWPLHFLHLQEGWKTQTNTRLPILDQWTVKNAYPLPSSLTSWTKSSSWRQVLHQAWRALGLQQCLDQQRGWMEGCFQNQHRTIWTHGYVLWTLQLTGNISSNDGQHFQGRTTRRMDHHLHGQCLTFHKRQENLEQQTKRVWNNAQEWPLPETDKMLFLQRKDQIPQNDHWRRKISMDLSKLKGIWDWPAQPQLNKSDCSRIWKLLQAIHQQVLQTGQTLNKLLKKDTKFEWTDEAQKSFDTLKKRFTEEPVLIMADQTRLFQIECDTSKYTSGAVLTQWTEMEPTPLCIHLENIPPNQMKLWNYDRELLSVIHALQEWQHYIQDPPYETVLSDHKNLTFFRSAQKLNRRQAQWSLFLQNQYPASTPLETRWSNPSTIRQPDFVPDEDHDNEIWPSSLTSCLLILLTLNFKIR